MTLSSCYRKPTTIETRPCLKCGKDFGSYGPENRICKRCATSNDASYTGTRTTGGNGSRRKLKPPG